MAETFRLRVYHKLRWTGCRAALRQGGTKHTDVFVKACQWCTFLLMVVKGRLFAAGAATFFSFSEAEAGVHLQGSGLRKIFDIHVEG